MCSPQYNPAGPIRAAKASVVKKPSIAGEMSVGMGIWRDNGGKCGDALEWGEMSRLTCLMCDTRCVTFEG